MSPPSAHKNKRGSESLISSSMNRLGSLWTGSWRRDHRGPGHRHITSPVYNSLRISHLSLANHMPDYKPLPANASANDIAIQRFDSEPYRYEVIAVDGTRINLSHYTSHSWILYVSSLLTFFLFSSLVRFDAYI